MANQDLEVHVFDNIEDAQQFVEQVSGDANIEILRGPKQLVDFEDRELNLWMIATFKAPLYRFRLLDEKPLFRLLPKDEIIKNWIAGAVSTGTKKNLFRIYAFSFKRESGELMCDSEGYPNSEKVGIEKGEGYCELCKKINEKIKIKRQEDANYPDICEKCNKVLVKKVYDYASQHKGEMRLIISHPERGVAPEQMEELSDVCWAGLINTGLPIFVADIIVGAGVMGQKRVGSMSLSKERDRILAELGISISEYEDLYSRSDIAACKDLEELGKRDYYVNFRENIRDLQNLAMSRYGEALSARTQILIDNIRGWLHKEDVRGYSSSSEVWEKIGVEVLKKVARFFSFRQVYVFGGDNENFIGLLAKYGEGKSELWGKRFSVAKFSEKKIESLLLEKVNIKDEEPWKRGSPIVVNAGDLAWYVFGDRRHTDGTQRTSFNDSAADLLVEVVKSLHSEINRFLVLQKDMDRIIAMAHNLKRPAAQMVNVQGYFDKVVYGEHLTESILIFQEKGWLKDATDNLYDSVTFMRHKVEFEANKLRYGRDIDEHIVSKKEFVPILGTEKDITGEPKSFWEKAMKSVKIFAGQERLSSLKVDARPAGLFRTSEGISISPENLGIILDNLSDNAAKYSFEGETIEITLSRDTKNGKDCICYAISNYGNGIDEKEKGQIGEQYYRGMYSSTKNTRNEGTGLGLYTVKKIVEDAGGSLYWESYYGGGKNYVPGEGYKTTFFIRLPIKK